MCQQCKNCTTVRRLNCKKDKETGKQGWCYYKEKVLCKTCELKEKIERDRLREAELKRREEDKKWGCTVS